MKLHVNKLYVEILEHNKIYNLVDDMILFRIIYSIKFSF
jgi:hypothetical protein